MLDSRAVTVAGLTQRSLGGIPNFSTLPNFLTAILLTADC